MHKPLVTIIIVTYNAAAHLKTCFESILRQDFNAFQLVIIDGGSTDGTVEIIKEYAHFIDVWISEPDKGIYDAMNKGLKYIKGQWVLFLGADDQLESGFSGMVAELKDPDATYYGMVDVNGIIYRDPYSDYRLSKLNICHQAILYSKSVFEKYQYDLRYSLWADWFLNIQSWTDPSINFIYKPHLISKFGTEGVSSMQEDKAFIKARNKIILKYFGIFVWLRFTFRKFKKNL